jgi:hypothetical protein
MSYLCPSKKDCLCFAAACLHYLFHWAGIGEKARAEGAVEGAGAGGARLPVGASLEHGKQFLNSRNRRTRTKRIKQEQSELYIIINSEGSL